MTLESAPPSIMVMGGSEERQEGNYASSDPSESGRLLLQNDLGLTLLPGSQIDRIDPNLWKATIKRDQRGATDLCGHASTFANDTESQQLEDSTCTLSVRKCDAETPPTETGQCKGQIPAWVDEKERTVVAGQSRLLGSQQSLADQQHTLHNVVDGELRYSRRVRVLRHSTSADDALQSNESGTPQSRNSNEEHVDLIASASGDIPSAHSEESVSTRSSPWKDDQPLPVSSRTSFSHLETGSTSLLSSTVAQRRVQSSTSVYPQSPKRRLSSVKTPDLDKSSLPQSLSLSNERSHAQNPRQLKPAQSLKLLQAELKKTRKDLFQKTRAESDANHAMYSLRKTYDELSTTATAHLELQKTHAKLLTEHRRLLESYNSITKAHAACRSTSSRKLAQRIVDAQHPLPQAAYPCPYPSPSPSVMGVPGCYGTEVNSVASVGPSLHATPVIDLTRSPSPEPPPLLQLPSVNPVHSIEQGDRSADGDDATNANMNGFDDEADELFDALWESAMVDLDAGNDALDKV